MTTTTAALVLAWIAILMLALATAGLLRRVEQLSSRSTAGSELGEPVTGLQLPMSKYLSGFEGGKTGVVLLFVSPSCATCQAAIDALAAIEPIEYRIGVAVREADVAPLHPPQGWAHLTSALGLFQVLRVPATPYLVLLATDGTIIDATMVVGSLSLRSWLTRQPPVASTP